MPLEFNTPQYYLPLWLHRDRKREKRRNKRGSTERTHHVSSSGIYWMQECCNLVTHINADGT